MRDDEKIALSVIVKVVGGRPFLDRCLSRLAPQVRGRRIEVLVPYDATVAGIDDLRMEYSDLIFMDTGVLKTEAPVGTHAAAHEIYDRRISKGLGSARGQILAVLEDYGAPDPDWCDQVLGAHRLPYGAIGGTVEHEGRGALNWAVYLLDFGRYRLPAREGPVRYLTDVNISYKRSVLEGVRDLWQERYQEVTVNWALARKGVVLWQRPQIITRQDRGAMSFGSVVVERFCWGRLFACLRVREMARMSRLLYVLLSPGIPLILLTRMAWKVWMGGRDRARFLAAFPHVVAMTLCWCLGECAGYITGREYSW
jgi:hypothetical protein